MIHWIIRIILHIYYIHFNFNSWHHLIGHMSFFFAVHNSKVKYFRHMAIQNTTSKETTHSITFRYFQWEDLCCFIPLFFACKFFKVFIFNYVNEVLVLVNCYLNIGTLWVFSEEPCAHFDSELSRGSCTKLGAIGPVLFLSESISARCLLSFDSGLHPKHHHRHH